MDSLAGKLLIASPGLQDPNFRRGVIYLLQHSDEGAVGLVLNKPLSMTVGEAVVESVGSAARGAADPLHLGGPCGGPLTAIHDGSVKNDDGSPVGQCLAQGLCLTSDRDDIERLLSAATAADAGGQPPRKFVVGYAGWSAGQLEAEIAEGAWAVADADPAICVAAGGANLWRRQQGRLHVAKYVPEKLIPPDPSRN